LQRGLAKKAVASAAHIAGHFWARILEEEKGRLRRRLAGGSRGRPKRQMDSVMSSFKQPATSLTSLVHVVRMYMCRIQVGGMNDYE
jgi:hypothetical protein